MDGEERLARDHHVEAQPIGLTNGLVAMHKGKEESKNDSILLV